jgi:Restriction endonuclease
MPKRSNAFQNLFHVIYRQLAVNATVTESKMLTDKATGEEREVDIVIESEVTRHKVTIGVECNAHKRKASVEWVERMQGKHQNLPTDKLVLVSLSGFYKTAIKKAKFHGIETISIGEAVKVDWTKIVGKTEHLYFEYYENTARYCVVMKSENDQTEEWAPPNDQVVNSEGNEETVNHIVNSIVARDAVRKQVFKILDSGGGLKFLLTYTPHRPWYILDQNGRRREIVSLPITLELAKETTRLPLRKGEVLGFQVAFGEAASSKGTVSVAVLESEREHATTAIKLPTGELHIQQDKDSDPKLT